MTTKLVQGDHLPFIFVIVSLARPLLYLNQAIETLYVEKEPYARDGLVCNCKASLYLDNGCFS